MVSLGDSLWLRSMFDKTVVDALRAALQRAADSTSAVTVLLVIGIFGAFAALLPIKIAAWLGVAVFGFAGAFEVFLRQAKARIEQLRQPFSPNAALESVLRARGQWRPKIVKEFQHGGLRFNALAFEELQIPLGVTDPLCPRCQGKVFFEYRLEFPGRIAITASCPECGWALHGCKPRNELMKDAAEIAGVPR